ncbi:MAG: 50S ribosomal protein L13 [Candidatus Daviesbacteria bacterium]
MGTNRVSAKEIKRDWHLIDAKNQILGRMATNIATLLMGKNKPNFVPYLDMGDNVVVINAAKVKVSGKKESQKEYVRHSGYPGGRKVEKIAEVRKSKPEQIITHAVAGMVPKNKLGRVMLKKLHVFEGAEHSFKNQLKGESSDAKAMEDKKNARE